MNVFDVVAIECKMCFDDNPNKNILFNNTDG